ncbi:MAG: amidohydrolase family protein [Anaerolineae bacterium]|nr:amidohydrolase family protein [Anaerolineae bacterium]
MPTLILPSFLITSAREAPKTEWGVRVMDDRITDIGPNANLQAKYPDDVIVDATDHVLAPGFVNAHVHLYGVLAHGIPLPSDDQTGGGGWAFLDDFWWPLVEDALDHEMICAATDWVCAEMVRSGITSFYDILEAPFAIPGALEAQRAVVEKRGLRGILSFESTERVSRENGQVGLHENAEFVKSCRAAKTLVEGLMCFHTTFTCSAGFIKQAFALGEELDCSVHMHCNEATFEPEYALKHFGKRTLEYYDELGVTGPRMQASQCVQLSEREIQIVAEKGIRVTHMPLSNCEVGGGIAPVPQLLERGVTLGLGSDGYINDFFEVMRGAFLIHKAGQQSTTVMPADEVFYLATEGGARALGWDNVGRLAPGYQADLQLIDALFPTPTALHNLYDQLVLWRNHTHVRDVMVAGEWRVRNGEVLDADLGSMRARVHESAQKMWARVKRPTS